MCDLTQLISEAIRRIPDEYFQLPIVDKEDPIYRERVYCYELYHQIRCLWPLGTCYSLCGEIDKAGHPLIRTGDLDKTKPDFLVHIPGQMESNELVMEVKPINATKRGIKKDLLTLSAYRRKAQYQRAILLVYGGDEVDIKKFKKVAKFLATQNSIDLSLIELWHHQISGNTPVGTTSW